MKAVTYNSFGSPSSVLTYSDIDKPKPTANEVLVRQKKRNKPPKTGNNNYNNQKRQHAKKAKKIKKRLKAFFKKNY